MRPIIYFAILISFANAAFAGEKEDVNKCIYAAKNYADISLSRYGYKYDKGWFSSTIIWLGVNGARCELDSQVNKLVINNKTFIIDGFAGIKAKSLYLRKDREYNLLANKIGSMGEAYQSSLDTLENQLKKPKPDFDKIEKRFDDSVVETRLRINGTSSELAAKFSSGEAVEHLRLEIKSLKEKNKRILSKVQVLESELNTRETTSVKDLRDQILLLKGKNESLKRTLDSKVEANNQLRSENKKMSEVATDLKKQLEAYKIPIEPQVEKIIENVRLEKFNDAYAILSTLRKLPLYDAGVEGVIIEETLKVVKPIPSSEYVRNLNAYKFILKLDPENLTYIDKISYYEAKIVEGKQKEKIDNIVKIIASSDDLNKHRTAMAKAVLSLIKSGECTHSQVKNYGGWVKSGERRGQYFMDCGPKRVWFDPQSEGSVYADRPIPEARAEEMCQKAIAQKAVSRPNFHYFDTSYTVHTPRQAVTYVQGFDVKNAYGTKMKYRAFCLIQPSGVLELSLVRK